MAAPTVCETSPDVTARPGGDNATLYHPTWMVVNGNAVRRDTFVAGIVPVHTVQLALRSCSLNEPFVRMVGSSRIS